MDGVIRLWSLEGGIAQVWSSTSNSDLGIAGVPVLTVQFHPSNPKYLFTVHGDGHLMTWCIDRSKGLRVNRSGRNMASISAVNIAKIKCSAEGIELRTAGVSIHGSRLLIGGSDGKVLLFLIDDLIGRIKGHQTRQKLLPPTMHVLEGHFGQITCHAFNPRGSDFCTGAWDGSLCHWHYDLDQMQWVVTRLTCNQDGGIERRKITALAFSCDGSMIYACSSDGERCCTIHSWAIHRDYRKRNYESLHESEIYVLCVHPVEPSIFVTGSFDGLVAIWQANIASARKSMTLCNLLVYSTNARLLDGRFTAGSFAVTDDLGRLHILGCSISAMDSCSRKCQAESMCAALEKSIAYGRLPRKKKQSERALMYGSNEDLQLDTEPVLAASADVESTVNEATSESEPSLTYSSSEVETISSPESSSISEHDRRLSSTSSSSDSFGTVEKPIYPQVHFLSNFFVDF